MSGAAGAWGRGAPVSKPNNSSSSTNGERPKLNLSKKTEPKDKENNTASPKQTKVEETKKPVEKRGWEVKATKSTESATESKKDIEEKKEENEPASTAAAVRSFAAMAAKPAAPPPVVDKPVQSEPEKKKKEDSPTKKKEKDDKKDNTNAESSNNNKDAGEKKHRRDRRGERSKPREPMVMNSRAAMLGDADAPKKEELVPKESERHVRDRRSDRRGDNNRGPPPVINERFAKLAEEEKEKNLDRDFRRRDNNGGDNNNSRDRDRGPPPMQTNSRFAAAADADRSVPRGFDRNNDNGPPPMQTNSRFAAVAADNDAERAARDVQRAEREANRGPPPVQTNSRFAAVAADNDAERANREMERAERMGGGENRFGRNDGPPPMQTNSRFAAAADAHQRENENRDRERGERMGGSGDRFGRRNDNAGPPPVQTGRFANLVQDDEDYVPAEVRNQRLQERKMEEQEGGGRFGGQDGGRFGRPDDDRGAGSRFGGRDQQRGGNRYGRGNNDGGEVQLPTQPRWKTEAENQSAQEDAFPPLGGSKKSNVAGILAPKGRDEVVQAPVEAPLTLPGEDEAAAKARIEKKKKEDEEKKALEKAAAEEAAAKQAEAEKAAAEEAAKAAAVESKLLDEFISGNKLGEDLQAWCSEQGTVLPTVEKLIFHLLCEKEQKNPDPECAWAEAEKFGAALVSLVEDDADGQMQVLWAIQKYCDTQGFPKINDEYLVQAMFRAMYKFDLAEPGAFDLWKEDESEANEKGKMKAVIQTMDWFTWLEEDDDDEEEEYEEEEE